MNQKNDRFFRTTLIALLVVYAVGGNMTAFFGSFGFPSIAFGFTPHKNDSSPSHYTLQFHTINEKPLETPLYFDAFADQFGIENVLAGESLINRMGIAYYSGDETAGDDLLGQFEVAYLMGVNSAEYDLVLLVFNPVERFSWGTNVAEQKVASFQYTGVISQVNQ